MTAQVLVIPQQPDWEVIAEWAMAADFNLQQVDCLIAIMLKILDGKCKMDTDTQSSLRIIYQQGHRGRSHLFDPYIHAFIQQVCAQPDPLSLRHVHQLRQYAECAIPKSVMRGFKQFLWSNIP